MNLNGYGEDFPEFVDVDRLTADGSALLERPGFWAAYYLNQSVEDDKLLAQIWGVSRDVIRQMQDTLNESTTWHVFRVDLRDDAGLAVVWRNFEDDAGVDYLVVPASAPYIRVATLEGEYEGPGISWPEIKAIARRSTDPLTRAQALLLLAPMLGDVEAANGDAVDYVASALRHVGGGEDTETLAEMIVSENLQWEPAQWRTTPDGLRVCDAESSPRNPDAPFALHASDLRTVTELFAPAAT
jgi:hypothetical protein